VSNEGPDWANWVDPDNGADENGLPEHAVRGEEPDDDEGGE
jgi:hypothetical protein